jgi:hypothetical protein
VDKRRRAIPKRDGTNATLDFGVGDTAKIQAQHDACPNKSET